MQGYTGLLHLFCATFARRHTVELLSGEKMCIFLFQIIIYGDIPKKKENVVYLSNHQSTGLLCLVSVLAIRPECV